MSDLQVIGLPGIRAARIATQRIVLRQGLYTFLASGKIIDGAKTRDPGNTPDIGNLRAGLLMGKITASGLYANSILGVTSGAYTSGGTSITVSAAQALEIVRRIGTSGNLTYVGPPSAAGTNAVITSVAFSAVNTTTGVITTSSLGANLISGAFVCDTDGSHVPLTLVPDGYPLKVTDIDGSNVASVEFPEVPVAGVLDPTQLLPWPADTSLQTWVRTSLSTASGGKFVFGDQY